MEKLTNKNIKVGMKVVLLAEYPFPKTMTEVISSPRMVNGDWCVLVKEVEDWVPIHMLEPDIQSSKRSNKTR